MKNIVFFDLETTGKNKNFSKVRIIEISAIKVNEKLEIIDKLYFMCNNDGVPIEEEASKKNRLNEFDLVFSPTFTQVAPEVFKFFEGCDIGGHYCTEFDAPILYESFLRAGITWNFRELKVYDTYTSYKKFNSGRLVDLYKRYTGNELEEAHSSDADTLASFEVFKHQLNDNEKLDEKEMTPYGDRLDIMGNFKVRFDKDGKKEVYLNFGKYIGKNVVNVDPTYFRWMASNEDYFPLDTRYYARAIADKLMQMKK